MVEEETSQRKLSIFKIGICSSLLAQGIHFIHSLMDFPADSYDPIDLPKPVLLIISLLESLVLSIAFVLHRLGSIRPSAPPPPSSMELRYHHAVDPASARAIKKQLRVVESARLAKRQGSEGPAAAAICAICLGQVEANHKVRELGNCAHGFHLDCIDSWIDAGWLSCPLCRADLLPVPAAAAVQTT